MLMAEYDYETDIEVQREEAANEARKSGFADGRKSGHAEGEKMAAKSSVTCSNRRSSCAAQVKPTEKSQHNAAYRRKK